MLCAIVDVVLCTILGKAAVFLPQEDKQIDAAEECSTASNTL